MKPWLLLLLVGISLSGCGTKFVYNNADWIAIRFVEEFVELNDNQQEVISFAIEDASVWHRREEIPAYIAELNQILQISPSTFSETQFISHEARWRQFSTQLLDRFYPVVTLLIASMSDAQVEQFMNALRVRHVQFKHQRESEDEVELIARYKNRISENLEDWLGPLTSSQLKVIDAWASDLQVTTPLWFEYQTQLRVELIRLFSQRHNPDKLAVLLNSLLYSPELFYSDQLAKRIEHNRTIGRAYLVEVINLMTEQQTQYFRDEVRSWRDILAELLD
ncbi:DUF6279 family lipoprotein [Vibrio scophthalmi]|uniref:DUF6279 family lipoprotein n=1 Tax=Vibrio scophthalmi TaxID=45658 RepID=UPI003AAE8D15